MKTILIGLTLLSAVPLHAESCDEQVRAQVIREVRRTHHEPLLFAKKTVGELRSPMVDWALYLRSRPVAEELLADFRDRNAEPAEIEGETTIELERYREGGVIDWARVEADYPGTRTIAEISRGGCDSLGAFGVARVEYHYRKRSRHPNGWLMHLSKQADQSWRIDLSRTASIAEWNTADCSKHDRSTSLDYDEVCAQLIGSR
ncbi:MAG TPA: hypothetical protein VF824_11540 [Thermoanaerobaculia bacterium]|jgi:hypothetical protein